MRFYNKKRKLFKNLQEDNYVFLQLFNYIYYKKCIAFKVLTLEFYLSRVFIYWPFETLPIERCNTL